MSDIRKMISIFLVILAIIYVIWPIDLIPDIIPVLGWLDDMLFVALAFGYLVKQWG